MQVITDANVLIAMLIKPGKPIDLFFDSRLSLFSPQLLFEELRNNRREIIKKSKLNIIPIKTPIISATITVIR